MLTTDCRPTLLARVAERCCAWSERWFPDAFVVAVLAVVMVAIAALVNGATATNVARHFGEGFWSLIPFTMQMVFIIIGGYVTADSPPVAAVTARLAAWPTSGRGAVALVATFSMLLSLIHWGLSLILASLLVRALAKRVELQMDYRAAGAAAYLGSGSIWALGLSSSAAQLQANPSSMPPALLRITGVIPFRETIFTWQSLLVAGIVAIVSAWIAWQSAPAREKAQTAQSLGLEVAARDYALPERTRPGDWLEYSPLLTVLIVTLGFGWLIDEFLSKGAITLVSSLNTYNFIFLMLGLLLQWRPRRFLNAVARSVPSVAGVLLQFPFYGGVAALLNGTANRYGTTLTMLLSHAFIQFTNSNTYAMVMGGYSALLGLFVPSAGGRWLIEAPYVMQTANQLHYPLGWAVQVYNAAEALPNLINPFWLLPVLGLLGLKAREVIGFSFLQFVVNLPLVLFLLWALGMTLHYHPPMLPPG